MKNHSLSYIIIILGVWWTLAFLLATFQAWGMFKHAWIIPLGIILSAIVFLAHYKIFNGINKNKKSARIIVLIYGLINFFPLVLQLAGLKTPGIDNLIAAIIGLSLVWSAQNTSNGI